MDAQKFWLAFMDTGAPEMYLLYSKVKRMEGIHVSDSKGLGASGNELQ